MLELANARAYARQAASDDAQIAELESMIDEPDAPDTGPVPQTRFVVPSAASGPSLEMLATSTGIDLTQRSPIQRFEEATRLKLALLERKREVLLRMRREGTIDDLVERRVEAHLDLEEVRLRGVEQLD